jgi:hypothetical protein
VRAFNWPKTERWAGSGRVQRKVRRLGNVPGCAQLLPAKKVSEEWRSRRAIIGHANPSTRSATIKILR